MRDHGNKMFNAFSKTRWDAHEKAIKKGENSTATFDSKFYNDQKDPTKRILVIDKSKVTREFQNQQEAEEQRQSRLNARRLSTHGVTVILIRNTWMKMNAGDDLVATSSHLRKKLS